jgi:putative PIN family toxin of toxin-antitoxin system
VRIVLDTNIVISGLLWNGPSHELLANLDLNSVALYSSFPMLAELAKVLHRTKLARQIASSQSSPEQLLDRYVHSVTLVVPQETGRLAPDVDDDMVIGTAMAASADFLITGDAPLLSVRRYEGGEISTVREMLQRFAIK